MSKGSKQRPTDKKIYDVNYESINWSGPFNETELTKDRAIDTDYPGDYLSRRVDELYKPTGAVEKEKG